MTISRLIDPRTHNLGGDFVVRRILPFRAQRSVGPFVFFDHFGPVEYAPGSNFNVRPHPHIGLSTVTYLFEGAIRHRDSLGTDVVIEPGAVNWMTAGRGIVHSERTPDLQLENGQTLHGLQTWVALPRDLEDSAPDFRHHASDSLPEFDIGAIRVKLLAGAAWGHHSPVQFPTAILYLVLQTATAATLALPSGLAPERAVYVIGGEVHLGDTLIPEYSMAIIEADEDVDLRMGADSLVIVCGGDPLDSPRRMEWNFVSSDPLKIERAKADWTQAVASGGTDMFPMVPGDEDEWIPLP